MKKYLIYTPEGDCFSPSGNPVENCQYLGLVRANDIAMAIETLLNENPWIMENGFNPAYFMVHEIK